MHWPGKSDALWYLSRPRNRYYALRMASGPATYTAILLAGSRPGRDAFAESYGVDMKALIPVGGEPMVQRPLRALLDARQVGRIIVLSQSPEQIAQVLPGDARIEFRTSSGTIAATMLELMDDGSVQWPLLVTTADHALLNPATVEEFCSGAAGNDLAVGVVERRNLMRRLPQSKRTWLKFRGGAYTGANLFVLASPKVGAAIELWRSVEQDRKKGWRVLSALGPALLLGAVLRLRTLDQSVAAMGRKLGMTARAVVLSDPLAGVDVDKPVDHAIVETILAGKA